jgi:DNA-binding transcriptional LysR family regulator
MLEHLDELRIADVATFLAVARSGSVTMAARQLDVTPSQVSKAVARLEGYLKVRLIERSGRGIILTDAAKHAAPDLEELVRRAEGLPKQRQGKTRVTIAGPSYLALEFFAPLANALAPVHFRVLEAGPSTIRAYAEEGAIDMALTLSVEKLPRAWVSTKVGPVKVSLFAPPELAESLGKKPTLDRLREVPFVVPVQFSSGQVLPGEDGFPLTRADRTHGHEAATIAVALELAATCGQLTYGPELAARRLLSQGRLVEVKAPGVLTNVDLYLHANSERVLARLHKDAIRVIGDVLKNTPT